MPSLVDVASVTRSKNAGPLTISFDLMFPSEQAYAQAARSTSLTAGSLSALFDRPEGDIRVSHYAAALAIKITMPPQSCPARQAIAMSTARSNTFRCWG